MPEQQTTEQQPPEEAGKKAKKRETMNQRFRRYFVVDDIKENAGLIRGLFRNILSAERVIHNETFEQAVQRLKLGKTELAQSYLRHQLISFCNGIIAVVIAVYVFYSALTADNILGLFYCIAALGPLVLFLSISFRASFRCWQIRQQRLGGLDEFIRNWREWWPRADDRANRELRKLANRPRR